MKTEDFERLVDKITEKVMAKLAQQENRHSVRILGSNQAWISIEGIQRLQQKNKSTTLTIMTAFSFENLMNIANFIPQTENEKVIVQAIKCGQKVVVIKEGKTYTSLLSTGKYALKQKILDVEMQLYRYGIDFISISEVEQRFSEKKFLPPYEIVKIKKYVTAKELIEQKIQPQSTIQLLEQTVLTDQAKEYIREKKIKISWTNEK